MTGLFVSVKNHIANAITELKAFYAASSGSSLVGYLPAGTGAVATTVDDTLDEVIWVINYATGSGSDEFTGLQNALNAGAGKLIYFTPGATYRSDSILTIKGNGTKIMGNGATINSYAAAGGITNELVGGTTYPVNISVEDLYLNAYGVGSYGWRVLTSYSTYKRCSVGIPAVNANGRGLCLIGDEANGSGPYYNTFINCDVQSGSAGLDHIGIVLMTAAPNYLGPNANTFIGCRAGQCLINVNIEGIGNNFYNLIAENGAGIGAGIKFLANTATSCQDNHVFGGYIEGANKAFDFTALSSYCSVEGMSGTGVTTWKTDAGTANYVHTSLGSWAMPQGVNFPIVSADPAVLDYYAEGTWTPVATSITVNSGTPVWTGTYTRIGNVVTAHIKQAGGNITTIAGTSYVTLPFAASQVEWGYFGDSGLTIGSGGCATYGNLLYFATALTASVVTASITFRV